jgi:hypothetical protein
MVIHFRLLLLFFFLGPGSDLYPQELSHQVLVPVAGVTSTGVISYSQTVGETAIEIINSSDYILTQGFQQPGIKLTHGTQPDGNGVDVYPNPARENVTVKLFGDVSRDYRIDITTLAGTVVISKRQSCIDKYYLEKIIPIGSLYNGIYFIRITSDDKIINRTFKIEKY